MKPRVTNRNDTIMLMDDEPHHLLWLIEFIQAKKMKIEFISDLYEAWSKLENERFRMVVLDLSVPIPETLAEAIKNEGPIYSQYPGLFAARHARTRGYRSQQVHVYSVHDTAAIDEEAKRIGVQYMTKGRPKQFKQEIERVLSFDPTNQ